MAQNVLAYSREFLYDYKIGDTTMVLVDMRYGGWGALARNMNMSFSSSQFLFLLCFFVQIQQAHVGNESEALYSGLRRNDLGNPSCPVGTNAV